MIHKASSFHWKDSVTWLVDEVGEARGTKGHNTGFRLACDSHFYLVFIVVRNKRKH